MARRVDTVTVKCLRCGHVGALTGEALAKFSVVRSNPHCGVRQALALPAVRQSKCACDTPSKLSEGLLISISAKA